MWCLSATWTLPYQNGLLRSEPRRWNPMQRSMFGMQLGLHSQALSGEGPSLLGPFSGGPLCGGDATGIICPSWEPVSRIKVWVAAWLTTPGQVVSKQDPSLLINDGSSLCVDRLTEHPEAQRRARPSHRALASHACHGTLEELIR